MDSKRSGDVYQNVECAVSHVQDRRRAWRRRYFRVCMSRRKLRLAGFAFGSARLGKSGCREKRSVSGRPNHTTRLKFWNDETRIAKLNERGGYQCVPLAVNDARKEPGFGLQVSSYGRWQTQSERNLAGSE